MNLMERDYMADSPEERKRAHDKRIEKEKRVEELWRLYGKKHKNFFDRRKIKKLEKLNSMD